MKIKHYKKKFEKLLNKEDRFIKKVIDVKWIILIMIAAFFITVLFSSGSDLLMRKVNVLLGILIILFFIISGAVVDMLGIAVTRADSKTFNSMSSKKMKGAKIAVKMLKNAEKVTVFLNDVIGDICNIMSGSAGVVISVSLSTKYHIDVTFITLMVTAIIASTTIAAKAIGKSIAINKSELIVYKAAKFASLFVK